MFAMFSKFFAMLTSLFTAGEIAASSLEDYAGAGKLHSTGFKKRMEVQQGIELDDLLAQLEAKRQRPKQVTIQGVARQVEEEPAL